MSTTSVDLQQLAQQFTAAKDKIAALGLEIAVRGNGTYATVTFEANNQSIPIGKATSTKRGTAKYFTKLVVVGLKNAYTLDIQEKKASVSKSGRQVWYWAIADGGAVAEEGIQGTVDVKFDAVVIAALANLQAQLNAETL